MRTRSLLLVTVFVLVLPLLLLLGGIMMNRPALWDPPGLGQRLVTYLTTNVAATEQESPFPELSPRTFPVPPAKLFDAVKQACQELGWQVVAVEPERRSLAAVVTTRLWRFKDDVRMQVTGLPGGESALYVRSASRVGKGDLGANARHILDLVAQVRSVLAERAD